MSVWRYILPKVNFLAVKFDSQGEYSLWFVPYYCSKSNIKGYKGQSLTNVESVATQLTQNPLIVIFAGIGVIGKECLTQSNIVYKVREDNETFLSTEQDGRMFFIRRDKIEPIVDQLRCQKAKIVDMVCSDIHTLESAQFINDSVKQLYDSIKVRGLFKFEDKMSNLLQLICARLKLPILTFYLVLLSSAFFVNKSISNDLEPQNMHLASLQQMAGEIKSKGRPEKEILEQINQKLLYRYAWMFDRIAVLRPYDIRLTTLALQPLKKPVRINESVVVTDSLMLIKGKASIAQDISLYVSRLKNESFANSVRLTSLAQERDSELLNFQISVKL